MYIYQIFCKHLWKDIKSEFLGIKKVVSNAGVVIDVDLYKSHAIHQKCVKCTKKRIIEVNFLV